MSKRRPTVYIIYTGGTIGMQRSNKGYIPAPGFIAARLALMTEFKQPSSPRYIINEYEPLIDSSNMTPQLWGKIAEDIMANYNKYDGFVVLHGTDTMAYTASALSFMLENLRKPVILTGSQVPLVEIRNDARDNLLNAVLLASQKATPAEVCIYFNHKLFRGNRVSKANTHSFDAFASPNMPPLAIVGTEVTFLALPKTAKIKKPLKLQYITENCYIAALRLFPGISAELLKNILQPPLQALVLETYGSGNAPHQDPKFLAVLKKAIQQNIIIVNCTQCVYGSVSMSQYAAGYELQKIGLVSAHDMTSEAALTKLYYLFSKKLSLSKIKKQFQKNLRGEME